MPQGLQVFDGSGNLVSDTSDAILKAMVFNVVAATDTATHYVSTQLPAGTNVVSDFTDSTSANAGNPLVQLDAANSRLSYKFGTANGSNKSRVMAMNF